MAKSLGATLLKPYYPASSDLFRLMRDEDGLQMDFMVHGVRSFASLRSRAARIDFGGHELLVADPASGGKAGRRWRRETVAHWSPGEQAGRRAGPGTGLRESKLEMLKRESERALTEQIQRLLRLPPNRRTHFLRKRVGFRASCL